MRQTSKKHAGEYHKRGNGECGAPEKEFQAIGVFPKHMFKDLSRYKRYPTNFSCFSNSNINILCHNTTHKLRHPFVSIHKWGTRRPSDYD
ncbi:hypothetical protein Sp245p_16415 (plasmid) [Azospirillum baldaniorum]|uniref:Uncharacterized protein n=1 Tax=Azospirillum baldaniorum TaxID=1064539 RepID=A0A9P1NNV3_9PROT|nr:hypothetical protein Sp245p_16415 [Azospirillum baldaniorum]CCC99719.1 protein of unknown function [Azospirillum baldaniorum]